MADIDIGMGKEARRAFTLDELTILPSRRTRDADLVDLSWQLDAYEFRLPILGSAMDSVISPATAIELARLGGLGVLNLEGLWTRHGDVDPLLDELADLDGEQGIDRMRELYGAPIDPDLVTQRIGELRAGGALAVGAVSPKRVPDLIGLLRRVELDLLVIRGTVVSAEHVTKANVPLDLKRFVRELDLPVVVGGCASYQAALHLMRTGAAGVLVGVDGGVTATTGTVTGVGAPLATAIADVRAARMRHLDETGVYVHLIADGGMRSGADVAKAVACGADAVMLGSALAAASDAPGRGWHWGTSIVHPELPQGRRVQVEPVGTLREILLGPSPSGDGRLNIAGALRSAMATCGYESVKELQKAELLVRTGPGR